MSVSITYPELTDILIIADITAASFIPPDLTNDMSLDSGILPVAHGGFADLWQAEWDGPRGVEKVCA